MFRKLSLKSSPKFQTFRVHIPYFFSLQGSCPLILYPSGSIPYSFSSKKKWIVSTLWRNGRWCSGILYVLILDFRSGLSLIYPGFLFRVIPYSVPWFETVQGSHSIFFQKTSGLSHISENHISETGCMLYTVGHLKSKIFCRGFQGW